MPVHGGVDLAFGISLWSTSRIETFQLDENERCRGPGENATLRPVVAGPVEATAMGNVLIQARAHGVLSGDLDQLRGTMAAALPTERFAPQRTPAGRGLT